MKTDDLRQRHYAVIGVGNIGLILIARLLAAGVPGNHIVICDIDVERGQGAASEYDVRAVSLPDEAVCTTDLLLIAPPPKAVPEVLRLLAPHLRDGQVVISFAALISLERLEQIVPPGVAVARVMPNAPSLVGAGMNPVAFGNTATPEARERVAALLATLGDSVEVTDEQMNWCVGLSGAAMRSLLPALEGMVRAGIEAGLTADDAHRAAAQVMRGRAALMLETGSSFADLKTLSPMETVDEVAIAYLYYAAARSAKEKMDGMQHRLEGS